MGTLFVVSTPIGNLQDITLRAIQILLTSEVILCEDTRRTGQLLQHLRATYVSMFRYIETSKQADVKLISYHDHNENQRLPEVISWLESGKNIALVSDAGTPLVNDPGFLLVREARKRGLPVVAIPGSSAVLAALVTSGLSVNQFLYLGYPPEKTARRLQLFTQLFQCFKTMKLIQPTIIFYCAPHKLATTLADLQQVFGDIELTIAREMTKVHEHTWLGKISEALAQSVVFKGEIVILISGDQISTLQA